MRSLLRRYYNVFSLQLNWLNNKIIPLKLPSKHFSAKQSRLFHLFTSLLLLDRIQTKRTRISGPGFYLLDQRVRAESAQAVVHTASRHTFTFYFYFLLFTFTFFLCFVSACWSDDPLPDIFFTFVCLLSCLFVCLLVCMFLDLFVFRFY